jgi:hypothetical protein
MPVIPATHEVEVGGPWSEVSLHKSVKAYVKNKQEQKRAVAVAVAYCLANARP